MNRQELINQIKEKQSFLCVGLDTDINKIPQCIIDEAKEKDGDDYVFRALCEFNALIIDATAPYCVAYKPNLAFYEAYGVSQPLHHCRCQARRYRKYVEDVCQDVL